MSVAIAYGIFTWCRTERHSNRYGGFYLDSTSYDNTASVAATVNQEHVDSLIGKRVKVSVVVETARDSGHCGDFALKIKPSRPDVNETVILGVGVLLQETLDFTPAPGFLLKPEDGRCELWIDPRKLYRLHDQTVTVFAEETEEACSPVAKLRAKSGVVALGDGSFQAKRVDVRTGIPKPIVESLGDGMFTVTYSNRSRT